jgi:hypothetical protein
MNMKPWPQVAGTNLDGRRQFTQGRWDLPRWSSHVALIVKPMKTILPFLFIGLICITIAKAAERPMAEIVDYGIYTGEQNEVILETNTPTGSVLQGQGVSRLVKQTTKIPA